jgi:hypothetical protein
MTEATGPRPASRTGRTCPLGQHLVGLGPAGLGLCPAVEHRLVWRLEFSPLELVGCQRRGLGRHHPHHRGDHRSRRR